MILRAQETWGTITYDTSTHRFSYQVVGATNELPYVHHPIVLNCDLTFKCNMSCVHCVARDMEAYCKADLAVTQKLLRQINDSHFLVIVVTGGEPLLPELEGPLLTLVSGLRKKGVIVDTNGSIAPSNALLRAFLRNNVLVRVSLDSLRPQDEVAMRRAPGGDMQSKELFSRKIACIGRLRRRGVQVAVQSVLHRGNIGSILRIPEKLQEWGINRWCVQKLIPTTKKLHIRGGAMSNEEYDKTFDRIEDAARQYGIACHTKRDRRHNCVFLMVGTGEIYTQGESGGRKICLGRIGEIADYFEFVSSSEHSHRYYARPTCGGSRRDTPGPGGDHGD